MSLKITLLAGAIGLAFAFPGSAAVTSVYNNMAQASDPALVPVSADWASGTGGGPLGQSFTTTDTTVSLQDISLLLSESPGFDGSFVVSLVADDGSGNPDFGSVLWTSDPVLDSAYAPDSNGYWAMSFSSGEGTLLSPSTSYWVGIQTYYNPDTDTLGLGPIATGVNWLLANSQTGAPTGQSEYLYGTSFVSDGSPFVMAVSVNDAGTTDTPEPATLALLGAGLAGVGIARRRQFKLRWLTSDI